MHGLNLTLIGLSGIGVLYHWINLTFCPVAAIRIRISIFLDIWTCLIKDLNEVCLWFYSGYLPILLAETSRHFVIGETPGDIHFINAVYSFSVYIHALHIWCIALWGMANKS